MLGKSNAEWVWVVTWSIILHSIGPIGLLYCALAAYYRNFPRWPLYWAVVEAVFYVSMWIYQRNHLQRPALHPDSGSKEDRDDLFDRCLNSTQDYTQYFSNWFLNKPVSEIGRENLKEFFRWAFLNTDEDNPADDAQMESFVQKTEAKTGLQFQPGRTGVKCLRLTLDKVNSLHRSLTWYMCIFVVDTLTHLYLRYHGFQFYRSSVPQSLKILPPRPQAFVASQESPSPNISYWHRPHTSTKELPVVFLHGIGVGLYPYMEFLKEMNQGRREEDGQVGILAVELLCISSRFTSSILPKDQMCQQLREVLDRHNLHEFVLLSHSYGSVIATHMLKNPELSSRISSVVLVDPISILLNQPDVAYNFVSFMLSQNDPDLADSLEQTVRRPRFANEWLLWYFGSKDIGIAHTLSRTFFWYENVLWKEDLLNHRGVAFLAENDSIVNAPKVLAYLQQDSQTAGGKDECAKQSQKAEMQSPLKVVWCEKMDHGQVFDLPGRRAQLKNEVLREARRSK